MLNANDKETLVKSSQTANLLVQDLRDLVKAANPLLAEFWPRAATKKPALGGLSSAANLIKTGYRHPYHQTH